MNYNLIVKYFLIIMLNINKKSILFVNKTNLPILVEGWSLVCENLEELKTVCIDAYEEKAVYSTTGEWYVTTYFYDKDIIKRYKDSNLEIGQIIGKFRSVPSYSGEYSWMDFKSFDIIYDNNKILFNTL